MLCEALISEAEHLYVLCFTCHGHCQGRALQQVEKNTGATMSLPVHPCLVLLQNGAVLDMGCCKPAQGLCGSDAGAAVPCHFVAPPQAPSEPTVALPALPVLSTSLAVWSWLAYSSVAPSTK